jgi:hypothetical protein
MIGELPHVLKVKLMRYLSKIKSHIKKIRIGIPPIFFCLIMNKVIFFKLTDIYKG